jgi:phage terminase small subunit
MYPPTTCSAMRRLTPKQEAFALAYCRQMNASDAYREAYHARNMNPKTINEAASRLLKNSKVSARIAELKVPAILAAGLSTERTLREIARVAYADPRRLFRADGTLVPIVELDEDAAAMIAAVEVDEVGRVTRLRLWDKNAALEKAMRHLGLYERDNTQRSENLSLQVLLVGAPTNERE